MVVMHFKAKHNRPRPSQICPALLPPMEVPGHPAYPSGHSTQAHVAALCLTELRPSAGVVMTALAQRVAVNREIAGVHYKQDSDAGVVLAASIYAWIKAMPKPADSIIGATLAAAQAEWA